MCSSDLRRLLVDLHEGATGVGRVQLHVGEPVTAVVGDDAHAQLIDTCPVTREVVGLEDQHVAAVTAATVQVPLCRCSLHDGRDHLDELVAHRDHRVVQTEPVDVRVVVPGADVEHVLEMVDNGVTVACDEAHLAETNHVPIILLPVPTIVIDAEGVAASRPNRPLFAGVSLTLSDGDRIGVVGLNGCGKSTLLRILSGETEPEEGVVRRGRGARIGVLSQSTVLPAGTVRQAVGGTWQGEAMLQRFGMGDMLDARTDSLSGGQTKRVALAALLDRKSTRLNSSH